mgnify:CR=1 FL=1
MKKTQTATEYLIILAVVIVIGLIVVGVLGGIPSIGGGTGRNADAAELRTNKIGVMGHTLNSTAMKLLLRNNMPETISLDALTIENTVCSATNLPVILSSGRQATVICTNVQSSDPTGTQYEYDLDINYTDVTSKATYTLDGLVLVGVVSGRTSAESQPLCLGVSGSGTLADPYTVSCCQELQDIDNNLGANYTLVNTVDCSATNPSDQDNAGSIWDNGGVGFNQMGTFSGTLDGAGFTITGMYLNNNSYSAMFFTNDGTISNMRFTDVNVSGFSNTALLAESNTGTISDVSVQGSYDLTGFHSRGGGLAGQNSGTIKNVNVTLTMVTGGDERGLISGDNSGVIKMIRAIGTITANGLGDYIGGIVGENTGIIDQAYVNVNISAESSQEFVGGIVGSSWNNGAAINNSLYRGNITGSGNRVGGIAGQSQEVIKNSLAITNISATQYGGGIVGYDVMATTSYSVAVANVSALTEPGGAFGRFSSSTATDVHWYNITGNPDACSGSAGEVGGCTAHTDSSDFKSIGISSNPPFDSWDFTNVWQEQANDFPCLRGLNCP